MRQATLTMIMLVMFFSIFASSLPLTLCEQVQEADYILSGRIESRETVFLGKANFVSTRYKLVVEKDLLGNYPQRELFFEMAGGDDGEKKFRCSDVPMLDVGEQSIFMLYKPEKKYFSLIVGGEQGRYTLLKDPATGEQLVLDATRKPILENGKTVTFAGFQTKLVSDIPDFRNRPRTFFPPDPNGNPNNLQASDFLRWDASDKRGRVSPAIDPVDSPLTNLGPELQQRTFTDLLGNWTQSQETQDDRYVYGDYAYTWEDPPTVFNQLPSNYALLGLRDQAMMANWNKYIKLYKVRSTPTGTFGYPDFENDICGFVSNASFYDVFERNWGPTEMAVCFYWGVNYMWEADIACNPAFTWTTNPTLSFYGPEKFTDNTLLHELGHAWGAGHPFNELSVMNYYQKEFRAYSVLYWSDVDAVRYKYANDIAIHNLAIYGHYSTGAYQQFEPSYSDTLVTPGSVLNIHQVLAENPGTYSMPLNVDVFLTPSPCSWAGAIYLTTLNLGTLNAESFNLIPNIQVTVPLTTTPGYYHVALRIATGGDQIGYDNATWINNLVHVTDPPIPGLWIGGTSSNWHRTANWSGNFIPNSETDVVIPAGCLYNPSIVQSEGTCRNIIIDAGAALSIEYDTCIYGNVVNYGSILLGNPITSIGVCVCGNFELAGNGTLSCSTSYCNLSVQGSWTEHPNSALNMQPNGNLSFWGVGTSNLILQSSNSHHNGMHFGKNPHESVIFSSASLTPAYIHGLVYISEYTHVYYQSNQDIYLYGNLVCSSLSSFEALDGTIHLVGMGGSIEIPVGSTINSLNINTVGTYTVYSPLYLNGDLTITAGYLNARYHDIYIKGSWRNNVGIDAFIEGTSIVTFNGSDDQNLYTETFYSMTVDKPSGRVMMRPGSTINTQIYTFTAGEILVTGAVFNIADISNDGIFGTYRVESGEINLHQDASGLIDMNANITIYDGFIRIYGGSTSSWFAASAPTSLNMYGGTLDFVDQSVYFNNTGFAFVENITGGTIRTSRSFMVGRTDFNPDNNIVELYGTGDAYVGTAEGSSLWHLIINKAGRESSALRSNTIIGSDLLVLRGNLMISAGIFTAPPMLYINGYWMNLVGPDAFNEGTGTVVFQGSEHQYCSTENFYNLRLAKGGGALIAQAAIINCNSYEWFAGAIDLRIGNFTALDLAQDGIYGDFYVNILSTLTLHQDEDSYVDLNGTLNMLGGDCHIYGGSVTSWWGYALPATVNMSGGLIYFHDQGIEIPNANVSLNISGGTIRTDGSFTLSIENFVAPNWTLYLSGGQDAGLWLNNFAWLNHLLIDKSSSRDSQIPLRNRDGSTYSQTRTNAVYANTNLRLTGNFNLNSGSFHAPALIEVKGNWAGNTAANYVANAGRVLFTGEQLGQISFICGFYDLEISKQNDGIGVQLSSSVNVTVEHNLVISDGVLGTTGYNVLCIGDALTILEGAGLNLSGESVQLTLLGDISNLNSSNTPVTGFYPGASLLLIEGSEDQYFSSVGIIELHDLRINTYNGASFRPDRGVRVHDLDVINGGFYSTLTGSNLSITGDLYVHFNGRWWDHANILVFVGNEEQTIRVDAPADSCWFNRITLNKPSRNEGGRSQDVYLLSNLELRNQGILEISSANLDVNGYEITTSGYVDVNNYGYLNIPEDSSLLLGAGLYVRNNGTLSITGTEELPVSVSRSGSVRPWFQVEYNGRINAEWCNFQYLDANGVNVMSGAIVDPNTAFNHCSFLNGEAGGSAITLNDSGSYTITGVSFGDNSWGSAYNVSKTENSGEVFIASPQGSFSGPAFEHDPNGRIQWNDFKADLVVSSAAWSTASALIGTPVSLSATIRNNGVVASGEFYLDLIRNLNLPPEFGMTPDNSLLVDAIAAGDSVTVSFDDIVWGVAENWQSWLIVDGSSVVIESNETNNISGPYAISWTEPSLPNIAITGLQWSLNPVLIGGYTTLTVDISNTSTVDKRSDRYRPLLQSCCSTRWFHRR